MRRRVSWGVVLAGLLGLLVASASGCSTVEGFGKDVQKGGEAIERAADRNRRD